MTAILLTLLIQAKADDKAAAAAVAEFQKAFAGTEDQRADALGKLAGIRHDRVFAELAKCLSPKEADKVKIRAIELLAEMDHPTAAKILADSVKTFLENKPVMSALTKASEKVLWDNFHQALAEPLLIASLGGARMAGDKEFSDMAWSYMDVAEKEKALAALEGLCKLLTKIEEGKKSGFRAPTDDYENKIKRVLRAVTGQDKSNAKDYLSAGKSLRSQTGNLTFSMWCPATGQRWDRKGNDAKAACPHHPDKKDASKCASVVALTRAP